MAIEEVLSAPRSPWQRAYVERVIGTIRRECLDHVIVFNETSLYGHLKSFVTYYHQPRTHLSLGKDSPESRAVQPPELGRIVAIPQVGGLHHRYERRAAWNFWSPFPSATGRSVNCVRWGVPREVPIDLLRVDRLPGRDGAWWRAASHSLIPGWSHFGVAASAQLEFTRPPVTGSVNFSRDVG